MKRKEQVETPEEKRDRLWKYFNKTLAAANKQEASPVVVKAFRAAMEECKDAGFHFWRERSVRSPLEAALRVIVDTEAPKLIGGAIPVIWAEQARDFLMESGHAEASTLEKTLIEHAAVCWMRLSLMEIYYTAVNGADGNTLKRLEYVERRLMLAQRRFTRAVESLGRVRMMQAATRLIESRTEKRIGGSVHQLKAAS